MADKSHPAMHSTGRGGAGNIGDDAKTTYVDGDIVREGVAGVGTGDYSSGRGGAGNMVPSPRTGTPVQASEDVIPEPAMRTAEGHENFHTGRGGQGNVHKDKYGGHSTAAEAAAAAGGKTHESFLDKAKHAVGLDKHKTKPEEGSALKNEVPK